MTSRYALQGDGESSFLDLFLEISGFTAQGDIMLAGNFNGRMRSLQTQHFDEKVDPLHLRALEHDDEFQRAFMMMMRFLFELNETHDLVILNGIGRFPHFGHHTCFPHAGGSSVVDYILVFPSLVSHCQTFWVSPCLPLVDHAHLTLSLSNSTPTTTSHSTRSPPAHPLHSHPL